VNTLPLLCVQYTYFLAAPHYLHLTGLEQFVMPSVYTLWYRTLYNEMLRTKKMVCNLQLDWPVLKKNAECRIFAHIHIENKMFSSLCENQTTKTSIKSVGTAMQNDRLLNNMQLMNWWQPQINLNEDNKLPWKFQIYMRYWRILCISTITLQLDCEQSWITFTNRLHPTAFGKMAPMKQPKGQRQHLDI
jgi:hypothetical protein